MTRVRGLAKEWYTRLKVRAKLRDVASRRPILVYQMGKVGSSTVAATLERHHAHVPILHVHTLSPKHLTHAIQRQRNSSKPYLPEHLLVSQVLVRKLADGPFPCKIVTLTREPIARAISFVFEDRAKQIPYAALPDGGLDASTICKTIKHLLTIENGTADPSEWFDRELRACFGIDVFQHPYDFDRGYTLIREGDTDVLVIRMEDLNRAMQKGLTDLLGIDASALPVVTSNVGEQKWYAPFMEEVKRTLHLNESTLRRVLSTRYAQHFYGPEIPMVLEQWGRRRTLSTGLSSDQPVRMLTEGQ